ncbi:MAG: ABC transporter ATP-binding protein [Anaerolineales bacterium]|nr:MAG: ABC transporter ATP-binding protein [Chloroflexota bacterium]MBE7433602.1 ABC transporter ATP-binding protein [Anaerolineales bacterium]MCE7860325.1 ABC transporter ATP-binding protein [Chloroflexi bacterium CFX2]MCK6582169.1 ABC transporter ATP-binding protein [Anaerolineales bacterium]GJQ35128.1 MAG: ABC transporter ATP-binding protein [Anaerolineaceae bacterium]
MSDTVISVENLSKTYQLGVIGTGTFFGDVNRWWAKKLGRPDPYAKIGEADHGNRIGESIWALDDVSFTLRQGEALGIIGRNGAGKSTLLKIMSRVTAPTSGEVKIKGRIASLLEVGTGFHPELTGRENIYLNGAILGMSRAEVTRKFDEIVDFSGVEKFIDTPVKRFSSGMYVRLAFAVAAHLEPEILVIDEVLAVGDAEFQRKCLGKMSDVAHAGRTVLFVSHNMPAILRLCSSAIMLERGRLVKQGSAEQVTNFYLNSNENTEGAVAWSGEDAPGTDEVKLTGIRLVDSEEKGKSLVEINARSFLEIEYDVRQPGLKFRVAAGFNTQGVVAFTSNEPYETQHDRVGLYVSRVEIPPNLLAEGEYTVSVSIFASKGMKIRYVRAKNIFTFQVVDYITGDSSRGDFTQNVAGVLRPALSWKKSYAGEMQS